MRKKSIECLFCDTSYIECFVEIRAGLHNDALVAAYMALEISPTFVVIHFTAANIHAARVSRFSPSRTQTQNNK